MLGYLKKFNSLPAELREKVSNPKAMAAIAELEKKYQLPLASFIMRVMVKEISLTDLSAFLLKENLTAAAAEQLVKELKAKIFLSLGDYLFPLAQKAPPTEQARPKQDSAPPPKAKPAFAPAPPVQAIKPSGQSSVKGASFFFSPDDEQEIRDLAEKIGVAEKIELPAEKIEAELKDIINRTQINFGSADLADRFRQILKTYLRGIRNRLETKLTLTKPFISGGLSFDEDSAHKVMVVADKVFNPVKSGEAGMKSFKGVNSRPDLPVSPADEIVKLPEKTRLAELEKTEADKFMAERDAPYDFSKLAKVKNNSGLAKPELEDVAHELAPLTPALAPLNSEAISPVARQKPPLAGTGSKSVRPPYPAKITAQRRKEPDLSVGKRVGQTDALPVGADLARAGDTGQMPLIRRRFEAENLNQSQKVKVEDVKYVPRVMSPLDEIKYLDLVNFRRLDKDPARATEKIKGKISLLEEEGYDKKLEGIRFWRSSPLNKLYLEIGHLSISKNKPVDVIIEERKIETSDYLTAAEFQAIMDLNKSLRF